MASAMGAAKAKARAVPMKGAVQGLATTHREHAGEEIAGRAAAFGELLAGSGQSRADLEYAGQVQADGGHHIGQCRDHHRLLQLEAPAQREAGAAQRERQAADRGEAHQHARACTRARWPWRGHRCAHSRPATAP
jgi:hypothetical protein